MLRRRRNLSRYRWLRAAIGVTVTLTLVMCGVGVGLALHKHSARSMTAAVHDSSKSPHRVAVAVPQPPVPLGVYAGPGQLQVARTFERSVADPVAYAFDYFDASSWETIANPSWALTNWAGSTMQMMWAVPMLPTAGASLAVGASGAYNATFVHLAGVLIAAGQAHSTLVLGWEPEQQSNPWWVSTPTQAAGYVAYWRQIVQAMRTVPGASFRFEWDVTHQNAIAPSDLYPGNGFVDIIGSSVVDSVSGVVPTADRWATIVAEPFGLSWFSSFAALHGKRLAITNLYMSSDTAAGGGGDDPRFLNDLLQWASANHLLVVVVWDEGAGGISGGEFPASLGALDQFGLTGRVSTPQMSGHSS